MENGQIAHFPTHLVRFCCSFMTAQHHKPPCSVPSARDSFVYISPFTHDNAWGGEGVADHKKRIVLLVPMYGSAFLTWSWVPLKALESLCSSHYMGSCLTMRFSWFEITHFMISHQRKPFDHKTVGVTGWAIKSGQHFFPPSNSK